MFGAVSLGGVTWAQFIFAINLPQGCWLLLYDVMMGIMALGEQILCVPQLVGNTRNCAGEELGCLLKVRAVSWCRKGYLVELRFDGWREEQGLQGNLCRTLGPSMIRRAE